MKMQHSLFRVGAVAVVTLGAPAQASDPANCTERTSISVFELREALSRAGPGSIDLSCRHFAEVIEEQEDARLFRGKDFPYLNLYGSILPGADFSNAIVDRVNFTRAQMPEASFTGVAAREGTFSHADLTLASFSGGAVLIQANFSSAILSATDFTEADLTRATLTGARLIGTQIGGANLSGADVTDAVWHPQGSLMPGHIAGMVGLRRLRVVLCADRGMNVDLSNCETPMSTIDASGLNSLVAALREAGHHEDARAVIAAREAQKTRLMRFRWREEPSGALVGTARALTFGWTDYGTNPSGAVAVVGVLWLLFGFLYSVALHVAGSSWAMLFAYKPRSGIVQGAQGKQYHVAEKDKIERIIPGGWRHSFKHGLGFSLFMAFRIGFRGVDVGDWIQRLLHHDARYASFGVLRTIGGIQSLLSLIFLVVFLLSLFGQPFG